MLDKLRKKTHEIIFEADTFLGKLFDIVLLILILLSVAAVMVESVELYSRKYATFLSIFEWIITAIFTLEYILRIVSVKRPLKYIFSFYGLIDLVSLLPTYLGIFMFSDSISSIKTNEIGQTPSLPSACLGFTSRYFALVRDGLEVWPDGILVGGP